MRSAASPNISGKRHPLPPARRRLTWRRESGTRSRFSAWAARSSASVGTRKPTTSWSRPSKRQWATPASRRARSTRPGSPPRIEEVHVGKSGVPLAIALRLPYIPVTRVENYCASGSEAFRGAVYAVASGACDIALALGVEKLKDTGYGGLPQRGRGALNRCTGPNALGAGQLRPARRGLPRQARRRRRGPEAGHGACLGEEPRQRREEPEGAPAQQGHQETVLNAPMVAEPLGLFDCCGVSDGAACAIVTTPEIARSLGKQRPGHGQGAAARRLQRRRRRSTIPGTAAISPPPASPPSRAYQEAGINDPRKQISLIEVHDCFSITELVTMEDLHISPEGGGGEGRPRRLLRRRRRDPCQIDGGLKCFGHPIGASGLRMIYEIYLQMLGRAGERQRKQRSGASASSHNLGGMPHQNVCSVAIIGKYGS